MLTIKLDNHVFTLIGKGKIRSHDCIIVEIENNLPLKRLIYYRSISGMSSWRLANYLKKTSTTFEKGLDYIQSNMMNHKLQLWVENNYDKLPIVYNIDEILKASFEEVNPDIHTIDEILKHKMEVEARRDIYNHLYDENRNLSDKLTYKMTKDERNNWFSGRIWEELPINRLNEYLVGYSTPFPSCGKLKEYDEYLPDNPNIKYYTDFNASYQWELNNVQLSHLIKSLFSYDWSHNEYLGKYNNICIIEEPTNERVEISFEQTLYCIPLLSRRKDVVPFNVNLTYARYDMIYKRNNVVVSARNFQIPLALSKGKCTKYGTYESYLTIGNYICKVLEYTAQLPKTEGEIRRCSSMYSFIGDIFSLLYPLNRFMQHYNPSFKTNVLDESLNDFGFPVSTVYKDTNNENILLQQLIDERRIKKDDDKKILLSSSFWGK